MTEDYKNMNIAVVGVSHNPEKYGYRIFTDMVKAGWNVKGINVKGGEVAGQKLYENLTALPSLPEMVITVVPPEVTEQIIEEAAKLGIKKFWMQPGSESEPAVEKAQKHGMETTYNQCIMVKTGLW